MEDRARLSRSIYFSVAGFLVSQTILFLCFARAYKFKQGYSLLFFFTAAFFHFAILAFLLAFRQEFALVESGQKLARVNLANKVTLARMSTLPTLLILIIASKEYSIQTPLLVLVALVFVTDFVDGWISRASRQVTFMGRMLDAISDYSLLIVLSIVFYYYQLIPGWIFGIVILRLTFQGAAMAVLLMVGRRIKTQSTYMGKIAIFATMALYTAEVLRVAVHGQLAWVWEALEYAAGAVVFFSIFEKAVMLIVQLKTRPENDPTRSALDDAETPGIDKEK